MCVRFLVWCFGNSLCLVYGCLLLRTSVYLSISSCILMLCKFLGGGDLEFLEGKLSPPDVPRINPGVSHFRLLKWETPSFILLGLWLQHPDLNPVNYKICKKIHTENWPTLWYGWRMALSNVSSITLYRRVVSGKRLSVRVYVKEQYSVWLQIMHLYI